MKARIAVGVLAMTLSAAAVAQQMMPAGYVDYVVDGIHWKFVSAEGQARFGTVFGDGPTEFEPFFVTCRGGQGTLTFSLPQAVEPAQTGSVLRLSLKGSALDIRVTKTEAMGAPALRGNFEIAAMALLAQGAADSDMIDVSAGRWKMGYAAREFATAFAGFRQACIGRRS